MTKETTKDRARIVVSLRLPAELLALADQACKERKLSRTAYIEALIAADLGEKPPKHAPPPLPPDTRRRTVSEIRAELKNPVMLDRQARLEAERGKKR